MFRDQNTSILLQQLLGPTLQYQRMTIQIGDERAAQEDETDLRQVALTQGLLVDLAGLLAAIDGMLEQSPLPTLNDAIPRQGGIIFVAIQLPLQPLLQAYLEGGQV